MGGNHHLSRVDAPLHPTAWLGTSLLCLGEFVERGILVATKIRFLFGKNPSGLWDFPNQSGNLGSFYKMHPQTWGIQTLFGDADWKRRLQSASKSTRLGKRDMRSTKSAAFPNAGVMQVTLKIVPQWTRGLAVICHVLQKPLKHNKYQFKKSFLHKISFFRTPRQRKQISMRHLKSDSSPWHSFFQVNHPCWFSR